MRILTADAMRQVDRRAIEELKIPGLVLMENAAIGVADALAEGFPRAESAAIFCGPGNNGGDGLALGRHLTARGYGVQMLLFSLGGDPSGDAARQLEICRRAGLAVTELEVEDLERARAAAEGADVLVDALFGTGLTRPLADGLAALVEALNEVRRPRLAVDLPSGLDASRPEIIGPCFRADRTVAFAAPKVAHIFPPASRVVGELVIADLGFPRALVERAPGDLALLEGAELAPLLAPRALDAHKGDFGHLLVVGGSMGQSGAVVLAVRAALRAGAGLVTAAVPEPLVPIVEVASTESMTAPLPVAADGALPASAIEAIRSELPGKTAAAVGPGLGTLAATRETVRQLVLELPLPLVLDADGLNAFAGAAEKLSERQAETVLTPHVGELARLLEVENQEVVADRLGSARRAAERTGSVVVLKGSLTLVVDPRGGVFVNPTGNPGMATGGTGDVLTGLVGGLLAQGLDPLGAAQLGVFVHGLAGDLAAGEVGEISLTAGDVLTSLPSALGRIAAGRSGVGTR